MNLKRVKRAIISVSDKSNLETILPTLKKFKIEIISSGGSFKKIKSMKYNCVEVSNYTEFPEILSGRVKTLHPKIHAGILNIRKKATHRRDLKKQKPSRTAPNPRLGRRMLVRVSCIKFLRNISRGRERRISVGRIMSNPRFATCLA